MDLQELNVITILFRLFLTVIVGGIIGFERGSKAQSAGLRTYILVCLGSAVIMMTNLYISKMYPGSDPTRLAAQVVSGIGFIGAGTIIVTNNSRIKGLTTAAGIWAAAGIGLAIGVGFYEGAIASSLVMVIVLYYLRPLKEFIQQRSKYVEVYLVCRDINSFNGFLSYCSSQQIEILQINNGADRDQLHPIEQTTQDITYLVMIKLTDRFDHERFIEEVIQIQGIKYVEELKG